MKEKIEFSQKIRNSLILLITAVIWGAAFVAQSVGMDYIGPQTFIFARSIIAVLFLIPAIYITDAMRKKKRGVKSLPDKYRFNDKNVIKGGILCGIFLYLANCCQQTGLMYTTAGKAGFITATYIVLVPVIGIFIKKKCGILAWIGVFMALIGLYLLCMTEKMTFEKGDLLVLCSAVFFACQIHTIDHFAPVVDCMRMSAIQFAVNSVFAAVSMFIFENPSWNIVVDAAIPILYCGILSSGVAYTLQMIGQKGLDPTIASLIMSLESVFSVVFGFLILNQSMSHRELAGCFIMCIAIVLAQFPANKLKRFPMSRRQL